MATSEAQKRATAKYQKNLASITFRIKREELERYKAAAEKMGLSFRAFILLGMERLAQDEKIYIAHDEGYTYGGIRQNMFDTMDDPDPDDEDCEEE